MENIRLRILLVEDDEDDYIIVRSFLPEIKAPHFELDWVRTYAAGLEEMVANRYDAYLIDYRLGPANGLDLLREATSKGCNGPVIILTGQGDQQVDLEAMEAGAAEYLIKDQLNATILDRTIRYAVRNKQAQVAVQASEEKLRAVYKANPVPTLTYQRENNDLILIDYNDAAIHLSLGEIDAMLGKPASEIHQNRPDILANLQECLLQKTSINKEIIYQFPNTNPIYYINARYTYVPPDMVLVHMEDITEHKYSEALLSVQRELALTLSSMSDLSQALDSILEIFFQTSGIDSGGIYLIEKTSGDLHLFAHRGLSAAFVQAVSYLPASSPQAKLVSSGKAVHTHYEQLLLGTKNGVRKSEGLRAFSILPIKHEGQVIATFVLASHTADELPKAVRMVLESMSAYVGEMIARFRAEESLRSSQKNLQDLFDTLSDFLFILDLEGRILRYNPIVRERLQYSDEALSRMRLIDLHPPEMREIAEIELKNIANGKDGTLTFPLVINGGEQIPVETRITHVTWDDQEALSCIARDVSERKKMEEQLSHQATHDALTGLPNRYLLEERLKQAIILAARKNSRACVALFNIDAFKDINETLGHSVGDELLKQTATRLKRHLSASDTLARMGNDEFACVLNNVQDTQQVVDMIQTMRSAFETPFNVEGREIFISASTGLSIYPNDALEATSLLKNASTALDFAKASGRGNLRLFEATMQAKTLERLELTNRLRKGIEQGEFVLFYQPQLNLANSQVVGLEALIRWKHPDLGIISPSNFIPIAEESGLINPLGDWVLQEVCRQLIVWKEAGLPPLKIAMNVSAVQFAQKNWLERVIKVLKSTGAPPHQVVLEVTESVFMTNVSEVAERLYELRDLGVEVHIDDFGTAYSSLAYLRNLPVDGVKIDQTFIQSLSNQENNGQHTSTAAGSNKLHYVDHVALVNAIIALAHSLRLNVVAEGIETHEQLLILRSLSCDQGQGYLFARPMPVDQLWDIIHSINNSDYAAGNKK